LCEIVHSVHQWLIASPDNVAVIHCKGGKGRTGLIISCCLIYACLFENTIDAMQHFATKRSKSGHKGIKQPSQKRYLSYFTDLVRGEKSLYDTFAFVSEVFERSYLSRSFKFDKKKKKKLIRFVLDRFLNLLILYLLKFMIMLKVILVKFIQAISPRKCFCLWLVCCVVLLCYFFKTSTIDLHQ
jgi:hypothetical protein